MLLRRLRYPAQVMLLAGIYIATAEFGLMLDPVGGFATAVWPPTGISLVALFLLGAGLWPGVALGALLVNHHVGASWETALGMAAGNTLEAVAGAYFLRRWVGFRPALARLRDVLGLIFLAAGLSTAISATCGVLCRWLGSTIATDELLRAWGTWWLGDMASDLIVAPFLFVWLTRFPSVPSRRQLAEALALIVVLLTVGVISFGIVSPPTLSGTRQIRFPWIALEAPHALFPILIWAAVRFGQRGTVTTLCLVSGIAIIASISGCGPFGRPSMHDSLLQLQSFMGIVAATMLILGGTISELRQTAEVLRESEQRYRSLVETSPDAIALTDLDARILMCNRQALALHGFERLDELLGRNLFEFIAAEDQVRARACLKATHETARLRNLAYTLVRRDGTHSSIELNATLLLDRANRPSNFLGIMRDISDRQQSEDRLRAALNEKETLLREVHHRVKNNLAVIDSLLLLQISRVKEPALASILRDSRNRIRSMAAVHESLYRTRNVARIEFAAYSRSLCQRLVRSYSIDPKQIVLQLNVVPVELDLDLAIPLGLLLNELVTNSFKHAFINGRMGWIHLKIYPDAADRIVLVVEDNGVGLPAEVDIDHPRSLGLDLVGTLTRQVGGTIVMHREGGTRVTVSCPVDMSKKPEPVRSADDSGVLSRKLG